MSATVAARSLIASGAPSGITVIVAGMLVRGTPLVAVTENVYGLPLVRPVMVAVVVG